MEWNNYICIYFVLFKSNIYLASEIASVF